MSSVLTRPLLPAEERAIKATSLPSFPINLMDIRRSVEHIMSEFRHYGFFDEFTVHDFSHCLEMIRMLDWIILSETKKVMSDADWLLVVLACYFHDAGLLITRDEFSLRHETDFPQFCQQELFSGTGGADYEAKVRQLPSDQLERFLYQEFVRANHARRIRAWIEGKPAFQMGFAQATFTEIQSLLGKLPPSFKRDLALTCESITSMICTILESTACRSHMEIAMRKLLTYSTAEFFFEPWTYFKLRNTEPQRFYSD
jgi:molecular chaperone HtpG